MAEFLKLRKDVKTPRRAILEFLDKATPKESPAIEDLTQTTAKVFPNICFEFFLRNY